MAKLTILHYRATALQLEAGDSLPLNDRLNLLADATRYAIKGMLRDHPGTGGISLKLGREIIWRGIRTEHDLDAAVRRLIDWQS
jgi:hypothetical protein